MPRGAIVGVIGPNGTGKTTLMRMIVGQEKPDAGTIDVGPTRRAFLRRSASRRPGRREDASSTKSPTAPTASSWATSRSTPGRMWPGSISAVRSSRRRSASVPAASGTASIWPKCSAAAAICCCLDEPTNDLDVATMRVLEQAMINFSGCAMVISHDRFFLDRICTHLLVMEGDGKTRWFEGNFAEYEAERAGREPRPLRPSPREVPAADRQAAISSRRTDFQSVPFDCVFRVARSRTKCAQREITGTCQQNFPPAGVSFNDRSASRRRQRWRRELPHCGRRSRRARAVRLGGPVFDVPPDPEAFALAHRKLGYRAAYCPDVRLNDKERIRDYAAACAKHDVVIAEVGRWCNLLDADAAKRAANMATVTDGLALAEAIGARCCVDIAGSFNTTVWFGPHPDNLSPRFFDAAVENARKIIDAVKPQRAKFSYEMMGWSLPDGADAYLKMIKAIDRPAFGVHLDPCNAINSPEKFYHNTALLERVFRQARAVDRKLPRQGPHLGRRDEHPLPRGLPRDRLVGLYHVSEAAGRVARTTCR